MNLMSAPQVGIWFLQSLAVSLLVVLMNEWFSWLTCANLSSWIAPIQCRKNLISFVSPPSPGCRRDLGQSDVHALRQSARGSTVRESGSPPTGPRALHRLVRHQARRRPHASPQPRVARQLLRLALSRRLARVHQSHAHRQHQAESTGKGSNGRSPSRSKSYGNHSTVKKMTAFALIYVLCLFLFLRFACKLRPNITSNWLKLRSSKSSSHSNLTKVSFWHLS